MVINNVDPMQIGRLLVQVPDVLGLVAVELGDALLPVRRQADGRVVPAADRRRRLGGVRAGRPRLPDLERLLVRLARPRCRRSPWPRPPALSNVVLQTHGQNTLMISDMPGPTGGILLKTTTGAMISVNDVGITISNGKGAMIVMTGPTVTINTGALIVT